jgi:site-specific DNA-methyltransferase (adenine-specific)
MTSRWTLHHGDCLAWLRTIESESVDAVVTDPPAGISFMGREWDHHKGGRAEWVAWLAEVMRECLRVLRPGGHALVWSLPRTEHWTACAVEDAGFEIRDGVYHLCAQGWPKSLDVSKAIDAAAGAEREVVGRKIRPDGRPRTIGADIDGVFSRPWMKDAEAVAAKAHATAPATDDAKRWQGWGTALKPAVEKWVLARKPIVGTVAANVLAHGTGALNIDGCRVACDGGSPSVERRSAALATGAPRSNGDGGITDRTTRERFTEQRAGEALGRWPANVVLSHAETCGDECDPACPVAALDAQSGLTKSRSSAGHVRASQSGGFVGTRNESNLRAIKHEGHDDEGGASRFFPVFHPFGYFGKAKSKNQRGGENRHPTVKHVDLMRWLVRLITPRGGLVLDAFGGSGTTGVAALLEGMRFAGAEADAESCATARRRLAAAEIGETVVRTAEPAPKPAARPDAQPSLFDKDGER